jgi:signal transduction histidine kinase
VLLQQSERLSLLIENVLSFAKMEEGKRKFVFEPTDIDGMLQDIVSAARDRMECAGFDIDLEIQASLPKISADRAALSQAVTNLLDNAVKYSGNSNNIVVKAYEESPFIVMSVKDFGVGIEKGELDKIFSRFYRGGDELTRTIKGSGLGLTLVKQIVEAHKGRVRVESKLGEGSEFLILIPLDK